MTPLLTLIGTSEASYLRLRCYPAAALNAGHSLSVLREQQRGSESKRAAVGRRRKKLTEGGQRANCWGSKGAAGIADLIGLHRRPEFSVRIRSNAVRGAIYGLAEVLLLIAEARRLGACE